MKTKFSVFKLISLMVLLAFTIILSSMLLWGLLTSLKTPDEYYDNIIGFPRKLAFSTYIETLKNFFAISEGPNSLQQNIYIETMLFNTILYAGIGAVVATATPFVTAYATAKYNFKFGKVIYLIVVITMVLPIVGAFPSELDLLMRLGLYDKIYGSWIQKMNFTSLYYLVFYAAFESMSKDYSEAAYIDGASEFRLMTDIMFPLAKNVFFTVMLILFIAFWNDYQSPALYVPSYPTLAYGIYYVCLRDNRGIFTFVPGQMAACYIVAVPIIVLFIVFKNRLIGNLTIGGVKG